MVVDVVLRVVIGVTAGSALLAGCPWLLLLLLPGSFRVCVGFDCVLGDELPVLFGSPPWLPLSAVCFGPPL